ncbi:hypothetical protein [Chitinophaga sp. S165]|uniref:hypothetical protein n=1 Tax=Chitinophaga sp. S165 TaxID=2135462 RepID=UPI000D714C5E|nr:hypothetical protein [Chitinophaga sp. S165]PWV45814.1 hypothetical protein C7475_11231 [Chitinophaga sp. S165]
MLETTTATSTTTSTATETAAAEVKLAATIALSSRLENPETTFTITLSEVEEDTDTEDADTSPVSVAGASILKEDGKTKVPGGPSALDLEVVRACIFELTTEPRVTSVTREVIDGQVKVTINAVIVAKAYEDREYDSFERTRFRMIEFPQSPMDIGTGSNIKMNAKPRDNNDIEVEIAFSI